MDDDVTMRIATTMATMTTMKMRIGADSADFIDMQYTFLYKTTVLYIRKPFFIYETPVFIYKTRVFE